MFRRCFALILPLLALASGVIPDHSIPGTLLAEDQATWVTGGQYSCSWTLIGVRTYCGGSTYGDCGLNNGCGTIDGPTGTDGNGTGRLAESVCNQKVCGTEVISCGASVVPDCS